MIFKKKKAKEKILCDRCDSQVNDDFSFCPYCGNSLVSKEEELREFGMLGRKDFMDEEILRNMDAKNLGITDKIMVSIFNNLMKNLDKQIIKELENTEVRSMPNGIKIKIGPTQTKKTKAQARTITDDQIKRMSHLPRSKAKTSIRRLSDKIICELDIPGILSPEDVFVSKLEKGYEIKAIGEKKVYVNSLPINLPLRGFSLDKNKLFVEFKTQEEQ